MLGFNLEQKDNKWLLLYHEISLEDTALIETIKECVKDSGCMLQDLVYLNMYKNVCATGGANQAYVRIEIVGDLNHITFCKYLIDAYRGKKQHLRITDEKND